MSHQLDRTTAAASGLVIIGALSGGLALPLVFGFGLDDFAAWAGQDLPMSVQLVYMVTGYWWLVIVSGIGLAVLVRRDWRHVIRPRVLAVMAAPAVTFFGYVAVDMLAAYDGALHETVHTHFFLQMQVDSLEAQLKSVAR